MARARNLKPSFFTNEDLATLSPFARLLFAGLWTIADRDGRLEDRPLRIKVAILPYDDQPVDQLLSDLERTGFLVRYQAEGKNYIQINTFKKHQNPHKQEQPSIIPKFDGLLPKNIGTTSEVARPLSVSLNPQPLTLNPVSPGHTNGKALRRIKPVETPETEKPYVIPLPEEKPVDSLVMLYKILQGVPYNYRAWDKAWGRWKAKAKELMEIFSGDYATAYNCLKTKGEELTTANRTWTFNTIVDGAHLWKQQNGGQEYAHINRERFLRDLIDKRKQKRMEGLRRASTPISVHQGGGNGSLSHDELPDGVRSPTALQDRSSAKNNGAGDNGHGSALGGISEENLEAAPDYEGQGDSGGGGEGEGSGGGAGHPPDEFED